MKSIAMLALFVLMLLHTTLYAQTKRIPVAYSAVSASQSAFYVTKEAGQFEKHGLFVDPVYVASGTKVAQAVIAGEFPVALAGGTVVNANLAGGDIAIFGGVVNVPSFYIFVHPSIKRPEDLKGKTVGITTFGSSTDFSIRYLIKKLGMEPDKDVRVLQMGGQPQIVAGMVAGAVQAGVLSSPANYNATKAGFQMLVDFKSVGLDYPTVSLVSTRSYIKKDPQTVRRFLLAYSEGTARLYQDKEFAMKVIGKYTKTNEREALEAAYNFATTFVERPPELPYKAVETILTQLAEKDPKAKNFKAEDFIDPTFYRELEKSGFFKSLSR
ncbi:MAG TPA: ABC transporter substrate-binding protein [Candidatus Polarisedimenticolaceae bacterium]|nr:ABC transporter substrate-binding protein [Candidatus Polarisedimenticolaceae bacterium]